MPAPSDRFGPEPITWEKRGSSWSFWSADGRFHITRGTIGGGARSGFILLDNDVRVAESQRLDDVVFEANHRKGGGTEPESGPAEAMDVAAQRITEGAS